nr:MAG TPA: hypothetical protein [Caudoviricetes sp.]
MRLVDFTIFWVWSYFAQTNKNVVNNVVIRLLLEQKKTTRYEWF